MESANKSWSFMMKLFPCDVQDCMDWKFGFRRGRF